MNFMHLKFVVIGLGFSILLGCSPIVRDYGYAPSDEELSALKVGIDPKESVEAAIGPSMAIGVSGDKQWIYSKSHWQTKTYHAPEELSREIVLVSFDDQGILSNIERFGLEDGEVITLSRRVTDNPAKELSFLRQLFGTFKNINASNFFSGSKE